MKDERRQIKLREDLQRVFGAWTHKRRKKSSFTLHPSALILALSFALRREILRSTSLSPNARAQLPSARLVTRG